MSEAAPKDADAEVAWLCTAQAVRARSAELLALAEADRLEGLRVDLDRLGAVAALVAEVTRAAYPDLAIPVHGRIRHFDVGGAARMAEVRATLMPLGSSERARALFDLVIVSVLLDAGAGDAWRYREAQTGLELGRSEGLAVASLRMFQAGVFSSDPRRPAQVDAAGLGALDLAALARGLQVSERNPLVGLDGRLVLLHGLGAALARPGVLFDRLAARASGGAVLATDILAAVIDGLGSIWPGRVRLAGRNLGDVWPCAALASAAGAGASPGAHLLPLHKLSQWLTYSLVEPLGDAGLAVTGLDDLTGLAEYRNGGLFWDGGVIVPRDPTVAARSHGPADELVVEWRGLTVALLDRLAPLIRRELGEKAQALPLANLLEGGTWAAGRKLAAQRRPGGGPPIAIRSDGTVF
jgi:hypothetical protein